MRPYSPSEQKLLAWLDPCREHPNLYTEGDGPTSYYYEGTYEDLAYQAQISLRSCYRAVRSLSRDGVLTIEARPGWGGGLKIMRRTV